MEGPSILSCDERNKGLLPRVVDGIFECLKLSTEIITYDVKLSMVEIYMEKIRDLFDLSKDNLQIKVGKGQEILLSGTTEISILDTAEALKSLSRGISNRAVGETQMNRSSSRSHCVYIFSIQQESESPRKVKVGKLVLVDLAGSEKVEKTGAEGKILEEAKTINKSLSALGNVISALTTGRMNHIPYRDSKLTRILQDALGGSSITALLCCCSPSSSNASESLSTLCFGSRAKLIIKMPPKVNVYEFKTTVQPATDCQNQTTACDESSDRESECLSPEKESPLEEVDPLSTEEVIPTNAVAISSALSSLEQVVEELGAENARLKRSFPSVDAFDVKFFSGLAFCISSVLCSFVLLSKMVL